MGAKEGSQPYRPQPPPKTPLIPGIDPFTLGQQATQYATTALDTMPRNIVDDPDLIRKIGLESAAAPAQVFQDMEYDKNAKAAEEASAQEHAELDAINAKNAAHAAKFANDPGTSVFSGIDDYAGVFSAGPNAPKAQAQAPTAFDGPPAQPLKRQRVPVQDEPAPVAMTRQRVRVE